MTRARWTTGGAETKDAGRNLLRRFPCKAVTKHGRACAVIVSAEQWHRTQGSSASVLDVLKACPEDLNELQISRGKGLPRKVAL